MRKKLDRLTPPEWFVFIIISAAILGSFMISKIKVSVIKTKYFSTATPGEGLLKKR